MRYFYLALALFFAAINFNFILKPLELVTGGTQGLALLIHSFTKVNPSTLILIINFTTLILSIFLLPRSVTYSSLVASILYPLFVKLTSFIPALKVVSSLEFVFVLIAGIICGITGGFIYKLGFSSGGTSTLNLLVSKYFKIRVALANFLINTCIIIGGMFVFGIKKGIYSVIVIVVSSFLINKIMGVSRK